MGPVKSSDYIHVGHGPCWRRKMLVTIIKCRWNILLFWSPIAVLDYEITKTISFDWTIEFDIKWNVQTKCENSQNPIYSNFWHFMEVQHKHDDENLQKIKIFQNIGRNGCAVFLRVQRSTDKWWRNSRWGLYFQTPQNRTFSTQKRHFKLKFWKNWNFDSFEK